MRADLLDAYAGVQWAEAQLEVLQGRIEAWGKFPTYDVVEQVDPDRGQKLYKLANVRPLPTLVNVETGLIINSLRSSLDVLANALAARHSHANQERTYFPICPSRQKFSDWGRKTIKPLSPADRKVIEDLKPWPGGHRHLSDLHTLDIIRKHRRLVGINPLPIGLSVGNIERSSGFQFFQNWEGFENDAAIGRSRIDAPKPNIEIRLEVALMDGSRFPAMELVRALDEFTRATAAIITLFD